MFTTPMLSIASIELGCLWIVGGADNGEKHCSRIFTISLPYCREFLLYHLVYNPIMYMIRNKEFSSTLIEKWARIHRQRQYRSEIRNDRVNTTTTTRFSHQSTQLVNVLQPIYVPKRMKMYSIFRSTVRINTKFENFVSFFSHYYWTQQIFYLFLGFVIFCVDFLFSFVPFVCSILKFI